MNFLIIMANLFVGSYVLAASPNLILRETLSQVEINGEQTPYVGVVEIDSLKKDIRLDIYKDICRQLIPNPLEVTCMARAIRLFSFRVPLVKQEIECGSKIYTGASPALLESSPLVSIEVIDHSGRVCKDVVPGLMEINVSSFDQKTKETTKFYVLKKFSDPNRILGQ